MILTDFVTRSGSRLLLNGKPFRFAGPNIYWLGLDENVGGVDWPSEFRVLNALDTAAEMGATVIRSHTLGASCGHSKSIQPERGMFQEEALRRVDFAIHEAGMRGLRVIIPFVCNWHYYHGGRATYTGWHGLDDPNAFYTHPGVIEDFKRHIAVLLNRVNSYNGKRYKDDPVILAWELGNELNDAPVAWVAEIAGYIKSTDPRHLVAHGRQFKLDGDKLDVTKLDILDVHYYPADADELRRDAGRVAEADKVYMAGEFGWPEGDLTSFLETAENTEAVAGTLFWSLFGHHDTCGYVQHFDGFSVHYPGNGVNADLAQRVSSLRAHAYRMTGREVPPLKIPEPPRITQAFGTIAFRGVVGAAFYSVEKSITGAEGPWTIVYDRRPADHDMPWTDPTRAQTIRTWYRVKAINPAGIEGPYSDVYESAPRG
ncbi:glycoside hydrolase 5 family protein [Cohnella candidum]|uniref:mannan endo-1,4-beta-mannosidase n=1 Tax=Cohnella candidum TaxID=2674991 RepID=A0A3G3JZX9_9BACL|nr:cellulase family glycosylhydrolase [Cohnella candidum]AYQ73431.1 hypothetical protein EAV92_13120 [Cohnella candidum]